MSCVLGMVGGKRLYREYTDVEAMVTDLVEQIKCNFSENWLLESEYEQLSTLPEDFSRQERMTSHMPLKKHDWYEVCCVMEDHIFMQMNNKLIRLEKHQVLIVPPGVYHNELALRGEKGVVLWLCFVRDGVGLNVSGINREGCFVPFMGRAVKLEPIWCKLLLNNISREMHSGMTSSSDLMKCYLLQVLLIILQQLKQEGKPMTAQQWQESVVCDVVQYIREKQGQNVDLGELAAHTNISINYLNHIFKAVTGKTVMSFCSENRIERAKEQLVEGNLRIKELAEQLGYYDQYHFCKAFKKATGMSPTQYRSENAKK